MEITHRTVDVNGLRMHVAEAGAGPLVLLLHGFPESWYSWRHQLTALAEAGYHAVAPDQRGYGRTDRPAAVEAYSMLHLTGDVIGLLDALGEPTAVVVGHDWGAPVAWHTAMFRPDRVRGVAALSVPWRPRSQHPPVASLRFGVGENFYMVYFQRPGVADAELGRDPRRTMRVLLYSGSKDAPSVLVPVVPDGGGFLDAGWDPEVLPDWFTEADLDLFAAEVGEGGFTGGLNWYRNLDASWALTAAWQDAKITPPALFLAGEQDLSVNGPGAREAIAGMAEHVPNLRRSVLLPNCGHWIQQEHPDTVNTELINFLAALS